MGKTAISVVSGAALLALTGAASAGPMSVASPGIVAPQSPIEPVAYRTTTGTKAGITDGIVTDTMIDIMAGIRAPQL